MASPWMPINAQYRANVLTFVRTLAARGARPFLLVPTKPYGADEALTWWRQVAKVTSARCSEWLRATTAA